jgi:acyl dehydratase
MGRLSDVKVGDEVPTFVRKAGFDAWNRYAAVNDEFVGIHMDDEAARAASLPGAIGMGTLQWAYMHNVLREWLGEDGRIVDMSCRFKSMSFKDRVVTASGVVTAVTPGDDGVRVELDVRTVDDQGNELAAGSCAVLVDA